MMKIHIWHVPIHNNIKFKPRRHPRTALLSTIWTTKKKRDTNFANSDPDTQIYYRIPTVSDGKYEKLVFSAARVFRIYFFIVIVVRTRNNIVINTYLINVKSSQTALLYNTVDE